MQNGRVVVITDIHGCYEECRLLLEKLSFDKSRDMLINLGDTIDRGPKIYEVFAYLRGLKKEMGDRCVLIRGNHEQMMLDATDPGAERAERSQKKDLWYWNSGEKTVFSFIEHKHRIKEFRIGTNRCPITTWTRDFSVSTRVLRMRTRRRTAGRR